MARDPDGPPALQPSMNTEQLTRLVELLLEHVSADKLVVALERGFNGTAMVTENTSKEARARRDLAPMVVELAAKKHAPKNPARSS
jgi:hypothetical protein